ncbi:SCO family protein [Pedobacter montanisoli]|uniref:SCO family protein n=1 Tax=Pedobacter montanisoli TaxID=2923277 RepID=A0ABS9ZSM8_9SPHI|nr:SCO family protein [Pedobacter montanisoli]MCJ0741247.1 SCO family protein [Pedobacter montanisoli]
MKYNPIKKILILATILLVPGFLYYLLQEKGENRYKSLPIFGPKQVASTFHSVKGKQIPDTIYHTIDDFKFVNQNAEIVSRQKFNDKILIVSLFYTKATGNGIEVTNKYLKDLYKEFEKNHLIQFVSLSIDYKHDKPEDLANYAKTFGFTGKKIDILTGDSIQVKQFVKDGLRLDAFYNEAEGKFVYNNMFVLLDTKHRVRGYYQATSKEAVSKLEDEIKVLIAEELRNIKDGR